MWKFASWFLRGLVLTKFVVSHGWSPSFWEEQRSSDLEKSCDERTMERVLYWWSRNPYEQHQQEKLVE